MRKIAVGLITVVVSIATTSLWARAQSFSPTKGQSAEQQSRDAADCQAMAVQQSGYNPASPPAAAAPSSTAGRGGRVRGAARGAAVGATAGAIGGDAGKGAAAGAAAGTVVGGSRNRQARRQERAQSQQQQAAATQGQAGYSQTLAGCMQAKGYSAR
jgi:hypothetical protein